MNHKTILTFPYSGTRFEGDFIFFSFSLWFSLFSYFLPLVFNLVICVPGTSEWKISKMKAACRFPIILFFLLWSSHKNRSTANEPWFRFWSFLYQVSDFPAVLFLIIVVSFVPVSSYEYLVLLAHHVGLVFYSSITPVLRVVHMQTCSQLTTTCTRSCTCILWQPATESTASTSTF